MKEKHTGPLSGWASSLFYPHLIYLREIRILPRMHLFGVHHQELIVVPGPRFGQVQQVLDIEEVLPRQRLE